MLPDRYRTQDPRPTSQVPYRLRYAARQIGGWTGLLSLWEIRSDSVLVGLKDTSQVSAQFEILLRSAFRHSATVTGSSTIINRLVSSANSLMFASISLTMSLI